MLVKVKDTATNAQAVKIRKLINLYSSKKHIRHYTNEIIYELEAPDDMARCLVNELDAFRDVVEVCFNGKGGSN